MIKISYVLHTAFACLLSINLYSGDKENLNKTISKYSELCKNQLTDSITAQHLLKVLKSENLTLIDTREEKEQLVSTLPKAITKKQFLQNPQKYKDKKLVAYCTIGYRSGDFAEKHKKYNILNLEGGVLAWSHFKGKFYKDGKETNKVHVYAKEWNFLNSNYKAVFE
ncbi:MAG: rhodanese-like domain-containing protein [Lentisphaeraceae bacterium]|nr:rhodanese-like domain-containing protein [Lentisphaeraceae bacterium]